ncbi:MAG: hypothetical protein IT198_08280 [Acidimicrobiia bacterium]|nr:hypothetical protein [Acidimicrobiia bacterium]
MAKTKRTMSPEHKKAIAEGRAEGAAVKRYLEQLQVKGKPGRPVDPERAKKRLAKVDAQLREEANPLTRLELEQTRIDLQRKIEATGDSQDIDGLEAGFVKVAKSYAARKNISYQAFRKVGVPASVLKSAGVSRSA